MAASPKDNDALDQNTANGGYNQNIQQASYDQNASPPGMAMGGDVAKPESPIDKEEPASVLEQNPGVAEHYPAQHALMVAARTRMSDYLASKRPQENLPKMAFDEPPDDEEGKRSYHRALDIANAPLSVFKHIKDGTLEPEHMTHMQAMYPESIGYLQKKITDRIIQGQLDKEKPPPYHVRQGLSMFMGQPLSGEMTPQSIQAAQAVFAPKPAPAPIGAPQGKAKKGAASLAKAPQSYMTSEQARESREQNNK